MKNLIDAATNKMHADVKIIEKLAISSSENSKVKELKL